MTITLAHRNTQKVKRFLVAEYGLGLKFDRAFVAWLKSAASQTMGDAVEDWQRRESQAVAGIVSFVDRFVPLALAEWANQRDVGHLGFRG